MNKMQCQDIVASELTMCAVKASDSANKATVALRQ